RRAAPPNLGGEIASFQFIHACIEEPTVERKALRALFLGKAPPGKPKPAGPNKICAVMEEGNLPQQCAQLRKHALSWLLRSLLLLQQSDDLFKGHRSGRLSLPRHRVG